MYGAILGDIIGSPYEFDRGKILNGIAYDKLKQNFLVTGKQWGNFYIIKFNE